MATGIKVKITGFEDLLNDIEAAGGKMAEACDSAVRQSAQIVQSELKSKMKEAGVADSLVSEMPPFSVERNGNVVTAYVGYTKGVYDPKDPSDGYKVVFLNYGTPHRTKHGKIVARGFIQAAKKSANPKVKKAQKQALEKILERLKR